MNETIKGLLSQGHETIECLNMLKQGLDKYHTIQVEIRIKNISDEIRKAKNDKIRIALVGTQSGKTYQLINDLFFKGEDILPKGLENKRSMTRIYHGQSNFARIQFLESYQWKRMEQLSDGDELTMIESDLVCKDLVSRVRESEIIPREWIDRKIELTSESLLTFKDELDTYVGIDSKVAPMIHQVELSINHSSLEEIELICVPYIKERINTENYEKIQNDYTTYERVLGNKEFENKELARCDVIILLNEGGQLILYRNDFENSFKEVLQDANLVKETKGMFGYKEVIQVLFEALCRKEKKETPLEGDDFMLDQCIMRFQQFDLLAALELNSKSLQNANEMIVFEIRKRRDSALEKHICQRLKQGLFEVIHILEDVDYQYSQKIQLIKKMDSKELHAVQNDYRNIMRQIKVELRNIFEQYGDESSSRFTKLKKQMLEQKKKHEQFFVDGTIVTYHRKERERLITLFEHKWVRKKRNFYAEVNQCLNNISNYANSMEKLVKTEVSDICNLDRLIGKVKEIYKQHLSNPYLQVLTDCVLHAREITLSKHPMDVESYCGKLRFFYPVTRVVNNEIHGLKHCQDQVLELIRQDLEGNCLRNEAKILEYLQFQEIKLFDEIDGYLSNGIEQWRELLEQELVEEKKYMLQLERLSNGRKNLILILDKLENGEVKKNETIKS